MTEKVTFTGRRVQRDQLGHPVTDRYGNDIYTDVTFVVPNCSVEPRGASTEENDQQQHVETGLTVFCADPAVDVHATDRATYADLTYEVDGEPARYTGSRFGNDHAQINLGRVTG
jgi:hypothetical protein